MLLYPRVGHGEKSNMSANNRDNSERTDDPRGAAVGDLLARREQMEDGKRYIVYYTFEGETKVEESENV